MTGMGDRFGVKPASLGRAQLLNHRRSEARSLNSRIAPHRGASL